MSQTTSFLPKAFFKTDLKLGLYRHYKGKLYRVFGTVRHSETEEMLVLYAPEGQTAGEASLWVRPLGMFVEDVDAPAGRQPRFAFVSAE